VTYRELLERLFAARRGGVALGLDRIDAVLDRLGRPDQRIGAVVHIAGTNGKGSTAAMVASVLASGGARVGVYSSPHLATLRERVRRVGPEAPGGEAAALGAMAGRATVRGGPAGGEAAALGAMAGRTAVCGGAAGGDLLPEAAWVAAAEVVAAGGGDALTFFEQVTAIALVLLAEIAPDVTVLEVGLGGRLDATNVVAAPVAVVTGVAFDHQDLLGDTLEAIAGEKAGIFKPGQRVVIGASGEAEAVPHLVAAAGAAQIAALTVIDQAAVDAVPAPVGLAGAHQRVNAAAALAAVDHLEALGLVRIPDEARRRGLAQVVHPGRFETVAAAPRIILDGAHNPHGARALAAALAEVPERPRVLVLAVSADKDVAGIVDALVPVVDAAVATRYDQPRSLEPAVLAGLVAARGIAVTEAAGVPAAIAAARTRAGPTGAVIIAGSLFAVGEARVHLLGLAADPIAVTDPAPRR